MCFLVYIEMLCYGWSLRQAKLSRFASIHHARGQIRPMGPSSSNVLIQPEIACALLTRICLWHWSHDLSSQTPKGVTCPNVSPFAIGMIYCRAGLGSRYSLLKFSVAHFHLHRYDVSLICNAKSPLCNFLNSIRFTMGRPLKTWTLMKTNDQERRFFSWPALIW